MAAPTEDSPAMCLHQNGRPRVVSLAKLIPDASLQQPARVDTAEAKGHTHLFSLPFCRRDCRSVPARSVHTYVFRRVMALPGMLFYNAENKFI